MRDVLKRFHTTLTGEGDNLVGEFEGAGRKPDVKRRTVRRREWDKALAAHMAALAEEGEEGGERTVRVEITYWTDSSRTASLDSPAPLDPAPLDPDRAKAITEAGGFVNPYTFVPTPPREDDNGSRLAHTGLEDGPGPGHARHHGGPGAHASAPKGRQWSGTLSLTLTTRTPLLLPVRIGPRETNGESVFETRLDPNGLPAPHGASIKGGLRSAFETITASRYGVFFGHETRLTFRAAAKSALELLPARVCRPGSADQPAHFRLCLGGPEWTRHSTRDRPTQYAAWVPGYDSRGRGVPLVRIGDLADTPLTENHGRKVAARVVLYQHAKCRVWRATHLAPTPADITAYLHDKPAQDPQKQGNLTRVPNVNAAFVVGWLSASGYSIETKHDERLFIATEGDRQIPITDQNEEYWRLVLNSYDTAARYHDSAATYKNDPAAKNGTVRSRHVPSDRALRDLPDGTLVYVRREGDTVTEVHPVMISRVPFAAAPGELLPENLRPAPIRQRMSAADRLFGWVPSGKSDQTSSGYRGHLVVQDVTCATPDWRPRRFPAGGVMLAPLSSPKPSQVRFYGSPGPEGRPMPRGAATGSGYPEDGGLRGRKVYRWREEPDEYWEPTTDEESHRTYVALQDHRKHPKQLSRHTNWVRQGVTFQVTLFLDGVPEPELGALLWLIDRGEQAPLRLGAAKPLGFGVLDMALDQTGTRLWSPDGVERGWRSLTRPEPATPAELAALVSRFEAMTEENPVLREATRCYLAAAAPIPADDAHPVHYPRGGPTPAAENYEWFGENEKNGRGWSLPHVREKEQRLPYLPPKESDRPNRPNRPKKR